MARKKNSADMLVQLVLATGKTLRSAHKAAIKEKQHQERLAEQEYLRNLREQKRIAAERARHQRECIRREKERARQEKEAAQKRARDEAEHARLQLAYASLNDRYAYANARHEELKTLLLSEINDEERVKYCKEDIALIPLLYDYATRIAILNHTEVSYPVVDDYLILSLSYERLGDSLRAIQACQDAIEMGIHNAAELTMEQRIEMLRAQNRN